ncbi:tyrosine-type recombinase/integrase [Streptomyces sp. Ac-502]|uniref:tyrosine-type recombinase/integrase n=1 Tax=Streptomyces sp. Ac-502 TaxID=3342801 RepID=UPI003862C4B0
MAEGDIDMEGGVIHVRRQLKKVGSKLVFALPKRGKIRAVPAPPHLLAQLKAHMEAFPPKKITLPWGDPDAPTSEKEEKERAPQTFPLVFTSARGCAIRRDSWNQWSWKPALAAAGIIPEPEMVRQGALGRIVPRYAAAREDGFHALRHTFASVQLHARETIVAVSKWLGHADPSITLRVYAHMMPEADGRGRHAMQRWFEADS